VLYHHLLVPIPGGLPGLFSKSSRKGTGKPFILPGPFVHITEMFFQTPGHEAFLDYFFPGPQSVGGRRALSLF
jgi:hypothetical protein